MPATQYNPAGVHGVDAVADALGVNPIEVNRLVARGRIKFTSTPKGPVITEDVLRAYTGAGALDLISDVRLSINGRDGEAWWPPCSPVDVDMVRAECVGWLENNPISQSRAASLAASNTKDSLRVDVVPPPRAQPIYEPFSVFARPQVIESPPLANSRLVRGVA